MTTTSQTADFRPEDVQQAEKLEPPRPEKTSRVVPPALGRQGFELLETPGFNISDEFYVYKPLRAWDAAQYEVDNLIRLTGGRIYDFVESVREAIRASFEMQLEEGEPESLREVVFGRMVMERWTAFLATAPNFAPAEWATRMIKKCEVRRIAKPEHHNKLDTDPTKDFAGAIFEVTGAGAVDTYYRGRRTHVVRVGLAAGWGSIGDFFVEH